MRDIIVSDRLTLRQFTLADATRVCALIGDYDVAKMLSSCPHPYTMEDADDWLSKRRARWADGSNFPFAITTKADGLIGCIGVQVTTSYEEKALGAFQIGYWLGKPYWGLGYATEAGRAVLTAFDADLGPQPLVSGHFTENPRSGHVLEKLGFHYVGQPSPLFCVARGLEVPQRSMLRPAPNSPDDPARSLPS
jgi:ribosomal-protein-alanine N-acetyltransferase